MRTFVGWLLVVIIASLSPAKADDVAAIPADAWQKFPQGVEMAVTLATHQDKGQVTYDIRSEIKNDLKQFVCFVGPFPGRYECQIYYIERSGKWSPLRDYRSPVVVQMNPPMFIMPGKSVTAITSLSDKEVAMVRGLSIVCLTDIWTADQKRFTIESKPKILIPAT